MAKVEGINRHIQDIDDLLGLDMNLSDRIELLKAKSIAMLAATQDEGYRQAKIVLVNEPRDAFKIQKI